MPKEEKIRRQIYIEDSLWRKARSISKKLPGYKESKKARDGSSSFAVRYAVKQMIEQMEKTPRPWA